MPGEVELELSGGVGVVRGVKFGSGGRETGEARPSERSNTHSYTTQVALEETQAVAAQAGRVRED